ncbi:unnamed protein product, partial [Bubo scandiacus]
MEMQCNLCFARQFSMDLQQLLHESLMVHGLQLGAIDLKKARVNKREPQGERERERMNPNVHVSKIIPSQVQQELTTSLFYSGEKPIACWRHLRNSENTSNQ